MTEMRIVGGLDVGTTGAKIALFDGEGRHLATYYREYEATHAHGRHEISFAEVREGILDLLSEAVKHYRLDAIGVTSFGETFAMLDENDEILAPSMLYTDPRGEEECRALAEAVGEEKLTLLTGVKPHPMYAVSKIMWIKSHEPALFARCDKILLGQDFIVYTLTGVRQIDYALAARTGALDIEKCAWAGEVWEAAGIPTALLSTPVPAGTVAGLLTEKIKKRLGVAYDITVVTCFHDQIAGMIGAGVFDGSRAMDGTGTVECIPVIIRDKPTDRRYYAQGYSLVPYVGGGYACYAFSFTGGAMLKWFRDNFAESEKARAAARGTDVYDELSAGMPEEPTGLLVLPHFAGAATPYMDYGAKAAVVGLTLETDKYTLYKALMEGTSYEMLLNFEALKDYTGGIRELRATGGGAKSDAWLQIKADILGMRIAALDIGEAGAAGTAAMAGVAAGIYGELHAAVAAMVRVRAVFEPRSAYHDAYMAHYARYKGLYESLKAHR